MRDLYYRDGEKLFKVFSCKHCGGDKLVSNKKPISKVEELVSLDIAYIMPIETLRPDDGITYECQCKNSEEYVFVDKDIPVWVSKEVYNISGCKSCGSPTGVILREDENAMLKLDQAEDLELYCPFCEAVENLADLEIGKESEEIFETPIEPVVSVEVEEGIEDESSESEDEPEEWDYIEEIDDSSHEAEEIEIEAKKEVEQIQDADSILIDDEDLIIFEDEDEDEDEDLAGKPVVEVEEPILDSAPEEDDDDDFLIEL